MIPAARPEQRLRAVRPSQPPWDQCQAGLSLVMYSGVTAQPQNEKAMSVPVTMAPSAPARDLRGAIGRKRKREGSLGVYRPQARPTVDAAVSHQERLEQRQQCSRRVIDKLT